MEAAAEGGDLSGEEGDGEWEEDGEEIEDDMTLKDELGEDMPESSGWLDEGDRSTLHPTEVVYI